jgi:hypothetical protein
MPIVDKDGKEVVLSKASEAARQKAFESLSKKAILVNLNRHILSTFTFDVNFAHSVCDWAGITDKGFIQVRKYIIDPRHTQKLRSLVNDALLMVFNHTRPWDNMGYRLLPMDLYDDFTELFGKIKDEFEEAVQELEDNYEDYIAEAKRGLGKAFDKRNYPDKSALRSIYNLEIHTDNLPDIEDVRLNLTADELLEMEKNATEAVVSDLTAVQTQLMSRMQGYKDLLKAGCSPEMLVLINEDVSLLRTTNAMNDTQVEVELATMRDLIKNAGFKEKVVEEAIVTEDSMLLTDDEDLDGLDSFSL